MSGEATKEAVGVTDRATARITASEVNARHLLVEELERTKTRLAIIEAKRQEARTVRIVAEPGMMPTRATEGSAGFDLRANEHATISPGQRLKIGTGVRIALPIGFEAQVRPRSSMSLRGVDAQIGTIDEDYRGEISVVVANNTGEDFVVLRGDRIAQLVIARLPSVVMVAVGALDDTARGSGGFGSSGTR